MKVLVAFEESHTVKAHEVRLEACLKWILEEIGE